MTGSGREEEPRHTGGVCARDELLLLAGSLGEAASRIRRCGCGAVGCTGLARRDVCRRPSDRFGLRALWGPSKTGGRVRWCRGWDGPSGPGEGHLRQGLRHAVLGAMPVAGRPAVRPAVRGWAWGTDGTMVCNLRLAAPTGIMRMCKPGNLLPPDTPTPHQHRLPRSSRPAGCRQPVRGAWPRGAATNMNAWEALMPASVLFDRPPQTRGLVRPPGFL